MTQRTNSEETKPSVFSTRVRLTMVAVIVAGLVLIVSGAGVVYWQHVSMLNQQQARLNTESASVALAVSQNRSIASAIRPGTDIQVINKQGKVVGGSSFLKDQPPISSVRPDPGVSQPVRATDIHTQNEDGVNVAIAQTITTSRGTFTIYTVNFGSQMENSTKSLIIGLVISIPITILILSGLIWIFIGLALRPIERMRVTVSSLEEDELDLRVPLPPGDDEVARLAATLNDMLERLESAQLRQREFISNASHELRSPIASLLATVEVARTHPQSANWDGVAGVVMAEAKRLNLLVNDLLLIAAVDERRTSSDWKFIDLDEILFAEATRLNFQRNLVIKTRSISAARVWGDPMQIDRSIRNIVDNAVRHATTEVTFSLSTDEAFASLRVSDDGPGIDPDQAQRLFERFSRSDDGRDRSLGGTGLGLAIVASIMEHHGGSVRFLPVESGASIELRIPLSPEGVSRSSEGEDAERHADVLEVPRR